MIQLYERFVPHKTGLAIDVYKPTPLDGEWYLLSLELGKPFIIQCVAHKTITCARAMRSVAPKARHPQKWCEKCGVEVERMKNREFRKIRKQKESAKRAHKIALSKGRPRA